MTFIALVPSIYTNVKQYGALGDGATDDTAAIAAARSAVNTAGGGTVFYPPGIYITGNQTLYSNVHDLGAGYEATILKLKNGANTDLFSASTSSINLAASVGAGSSTGVANWSIRHMTLDGNKANQTSGTSYPLRFYGYGFLLESLRLRNGYSGGILHDWNPSAQPSHTVEACLSNVRVIDCNGIGIEAGGPTDSQWSNVLVATSSSHGVHLCPNAPGIQATNCHVWNYGGAGDVCWLIETGYGQFSNCEGEGSPTYNVVILGNKVTWIGGIIYAGYQATPLAGLQLGQTAGLTPYSGQILQSGGVTTAVTPSNYRIQTTIADCTGSKGAFWLANDGGGFLDMQVSQTSGTAYTGSPSHTTTLLLRVAGLTPDGSNQKGGSLTVGTSSYAALAVYDATGRLVFNVDSYDTPPSLSLYNATTLASYDTSSHNLVTLSSGIFTFGQGYDTTLYRGAAGILQTDGGLALGQSASAPDPGNAGTITTAGIGMARVSPAASRTGVILQAGTQPGQVCTVINESSSFTVQFAASGTSHVAQGTGLTIAANGKYLFQWDTATSLWY